MAIDLSRFAKAFYEEAQDHLAAMETLLVAIDAGRCDDESMRPWTLIPAMGLIVRAS